MVAGQRKMPTISAFLVSYTHSYDKKFPCSVNYMNYYFKILSMGVITFQSLDNSMGSKHPPEVVIVQYHFKFCFVFYNIVKCIKLGNNSLRTLHFSHYAIICDIIPKSTAFISNNSKSKVSGFLDVTINCIQNNWLLLWIWNDDWKKRSHYNQVMKKNYFKVKANNYN